MDVHRGFIFINFVFYVHKKAPAETIIFFLILKLIIMVDTKSLEVTRSNWESSHGRVASSYSAGVDAAQNVTAKAIAGEEVYAAKMQEAIANRSRAKGLEKSSDEKWRKGAKEKGATRIAQGMAAAKQEYATGMGEVLSVIQGVTIAPRTADPIANVDGRVKPIVAALAAMKKK